MCVCVCVIPALFGSFDTCSRTSGVTEHVGHTQDTIHGKYDGTVEADGDSLVVDGQKIALSHTRDPAEIPFGEHGAEYVSLACRSR